MNLIFHVKCQLCGNTADREFYYMPAEDDTLDGSVFSFTRYRLVCKKCSHEMELTLSVKPKA